MLTAEKVEVGLGVETHQATVINTQSVITPTWRQDPLLVEGFREFKFFFKKAEQGDKLIPPIRIPTYFVPLAVRLAEQWGQDDRHQYDIGTDTQGRTDFAYGLYRNGREDHIATVFPHAQTNDKIAMVYTLEQTNVFFELLFEAKLREEEGWRVIKPVDKYALDPQGKNIKWPEGK